MLGNQTSCRVIHSHETLAKQMDMERKAGQDNIGSQHNPPRLSRDIEHGRQQSMFQLPSVASDLLFE